MNKNQLKKIIQTMIKLSLKQENYILTDKEQKLLDKCRSLYNEY